MICRVLNVIYKCAPDMQGRIFGADMMVTTITFPFSQLLAGLLVDNVFEPAMAGESFLADTFAWLVGTGSGAGFGLMILIAGFVSVLTGLVGYANPKIREIETLLPDHEGVKEE